MPLYFSCPCGKCEECKRDRQNEWFVRSFYEWEMVRHKGGCGFFYTLTFDDEHLPRYNGIPCFDRKLVVDFIKRLKERLSRKYGVDCTYLLSCEFGELYKRPHIHGEFFVTRQLLPWSFFKEVQEAWQQGFVYAGTDGGLLTSCAGILYVTKYITKDFSYTNVDKHLYMSIKDDYSKMYSSWFENEGVELNAPETFDLLIKEHNLWTGKKEVSSWYNAFMKEYRDHSPFNVSSLKFGYDMINRKSRLNLVEDEVLVPFGRQWIWMPLPRYAIRNLYFDRVRNERDGKKNKFVLNVVGKQHFLDTLDKKIDERALAFKNFFEHTRLTDYQFTLLDSHFNFIGNKDLRFFLDNLKCDFRRLAIYALVYRNRFSLGTEDYDYWHEYKTYLSDLFQICENKSNTPLAEWSTKAINHINDNLFNFHPQFQMYEQIYLLYTQMVGIIRKEQAEARFLKYQTERKLRDVLKMSNLNLKKAI